VRAQLVIGAITLLVSARLFVWTWRISRMFEEWPGPRQRRRLLSGMTQWAGMWMLCVGSFLISAGNWSNAIGVIGVGGMLFAQTAWMRSRLFPWD
jgi:hypothetical protein